MSQVQGPLLFHPAIATEIIQDQLTLNISPIVKPIKLGIPVEA